MAFLKLDPQFVSLLDVFVLHDRVGALGVEVAVVCVLEILVQHLFPASFAFRRKETGTKCQDILHDHLLERDWTGHPVPSSVFGRTEI